MDDGVEPNDTTNDDAAALPSLDTAMARVLGCLIEKESTTPDAYPLTVNAAHAAANQKTARDPVMQLSQGEVHHALRQLERMGWARQHFSSRAERYAHRTVEVLSLTRQQTVLLGLLLLRGAQTAHELLARSERMASFAGVEDVRHHLERMAQKDAPLVVQLPRASGQREERYLHLLCGAVEVPDDGMRVAGAARRVGDRDQAAGEVEALAARVAALEQQLAELEARVRRIEPAAG